MNKVLNVKLEPFDFIQHGEQLWKWLSSPHVVRWWGEPEAQLAISLQRPDTGEPSLITADSSPVGYLGWQRVELPVLQGFRPYGKYQDPEYGPCWVMVVDLPQVAT